MEDTIVAIRRILRKAAMNDEFMLRVIGGTWEAHACNQNNAVPLGEVSGGFWVRADTASEAVAMLYMDVRAVYGDPRLRLKGEGSGSD